MQRRPFRQAARTSFFVAALLLGCSASGSDGDTDTDTATGETSDGGNADSGGSTDQTPASTSNSTESAGAESSSSTQGATSQDPTTGGGSDGCPSDAECFGPDDMSCEFGGACLACTCIGGDPPGKGSYGECGSCLPDEWALEEGIGCVCMPQCDGDGLCPPPPERLEPGVQEPSCGVGGYEGCLIPCDADGGRVCPSGMTCQLTNKSNGYCTFGPPR